MSLQFVTSENSKNTCTVANFKRGNSAFYDGRQFKIVGHKNVQFAADGKTPAADAPLLKVFICASLDGTIIPDTYIWMSSYRADRVKRDIYDRIVEKDGTFDKDVFAIINDEANAEKTLDEAADMIIAKLNNRPLKIRRKSYEALNSNRQKQTMSIPCIDYMA